MKSATQVRKPRCSIPSRDSVSIARKRKTPSGSTPSIESDPTSLHRVARSRFLISYVQAAPQRHALPRCRLRRRVSALCHRADDRQDAPPEGGGRGGGLEHVHG